MNEELIHPKELPFQLYEVLDTESLLKRARFEEHNKETFDAILETANKIATENTLQPNIINICN